MTQNDDFYVIKSWKWNTMISPISGENKGINHDHSKNDWVSKYTKLNKNWVKGPFNVLMPKFTWLKWLIFNFFV